MCTADSVAALVPEPVSDASNGGASGSSVVTGPSIVQAVAETVAGYSGTPLAQKLGIKAGHTVALLGAPNGWTLELPAEVVVKRQIRGQADVVVAFFTSAAILEGRLDRLGAMVFPDGGLWIAWPKKASGMKTDLTDNAIRGAALPRGLVDNKVCALDATWSGLRLVWRRENRQNR
jgi:hypothetical protein